MPHDTYKIHFGTILGGNTCNMNHETRVRMTSKGLAGVRMQSWCFSHRQPLSDWTSHISSVSSLLWLMPPYWTHSFLFLFFLFYYAGIVKISHYLHYHIHSCYLNNLCIVNIFILMLNDTRVASLIILFHT